MRELRIHGRGGQGSVTAAELIAVAAFEGGVFAQAFPAFGVERRGAPVQAFVRFNDKKIRLRSQVYEPDYIIVQDSTLIKDVNVFLGVKSGGIVIVNTEKARVIYSAGWCKADHDRCYVHCPQSDWSADHQYLAHGRICRCNR